MAKVLLFTPTAHNKRGGKKQQAGGPLGANPLIADDEGRYPLHIAAWQGDLSLVYLLLQVIATCMPKMDHIFYASISKSVRSSNREVGVGSLLNPRSRFV